MCSLANTPECGEHTRIRAHNVADGERPHNCTFAPHTRPDGEIDGVLEVALLCGVHRLADEIG
eukprot:1054255-Prymnesium_polylepis.1